MFFQDGPAGSARAIKGVKGRISVVTSTTESRRHFH